MIQVSGFKIKTRFILSMVMVIAFFQITMMIGVNANPIALANPSSESSVSTSTSDRIVARAVPPKQVLQCPLINCCLGTEGFPCYGEYDAPNGLTFKMVGECRGTKCICGPNGYPEM